MFDIIVIIIHIARYFRGASQIRLQLYVKNEQRPNIHQKEKKRTVINFMDFVFFKCICWLCLHQPDILIPYTPHNTIAQSRINNQQHAFYHISLRTEIIVVQPRCYQNRRFMRAAGVRITYRCPCFENVLK